MSTNNALPCSEAREKRILGEVVRKLNSLGIQQHPDPQETLTEVVEKLCGKDQRVQYVRTQTELSDMDMFETTCLLNGWRARGQAGNGVMADNIAACTMILSVLSNYKMPDRSKSVANGNGYKSFAYLSLGIRLQWDMSFRAEEEGSGALPSCYLPKVKKNISKAPLWPSPKSEIISSKTFRSKYEILDRIATCSFSVVMMGKALQSDQSVVLKFETENCRHPKLEYEREVLRRLSKKGVPVPALLDFFMYEKCFCQVTSFIGPSIQMLFDSCKSTHRRFSCSTVCRLGLGMLSCLEAVHAAGFIHQDIKPHNFVLDASYKVFVIDFGLSKPANKGRDWAHIYETQDRHLLSNLQYSRVGSKRYASVRSHQGFCQTFQDDLISLGFMFAYLLGGCLPWKGLEEQQVLEMKMDMEAQNYSPLYSENVKKLDVPGREVLKDFIVTALSDDNGGPEVYTQLRRILQRGVVSESKFEWELNSEGTFYA